MQSPTIVNFDGSDPQYGGAIYQGSTFEAYVTVRDLQGVPVSLADYTLAAQARRSYKDVTPAFTFTTNFQDTTENGILYPASVIHLFLGASVTRNIPPALYKYDVELTLATNSEIVIKPFLGTIKVINEVTK
jgi:hypothetical protein